MAIIDTIEHISAYCDRWCERCAFTSRCSLYAVQAATAMCDGDFEAGLKLALGPPQVPNRPARESVERDFDVEEPTEQEIAETRRQQHAQDERLDHLPISTIATKVMLLSYTWLAAHAEDCRARMPSLDEPLAVAAWDSAFIGAKIHRALSGHDDFLHGNDFDDDPLQNDWNGSAKVALISIVRSVEAWTAIAGATGDPDAAQMAAELRALRIEMERMFPDAWRFVRPGFDAMPADGDSSQ